MLSSLHMVVLSLCGLVLSHVAAAENTTTLPHPITLAAISPGPNKTFPAGEPLPVVFAFTYASSALQAYGPGSFTWSIVRANATRDRFGRFDNIEDDIAIGLVKFPAGDGALFGQTDYTTDDLLQHAYGDTFYYTVSLGGSGGLNDEVDIRNELLPGDYSFSWNWNYQQTCGDLIMANNDGSYNFSIYESSSSGQVDPGILLAMNNGCTLPVHRFDIEGANERDACADFMEEGALAEYEFEEGDDECGVRLGDSVLFCLGAILDGVDEDRFCAGEEVESAFEETRRSLDGYDIGEYYPLIKEEGSEAYSTSNRTGVSSEADPTSTADTAGGSSTAASGGVRFVASWDVLAMAVVLGAVATR